MPVRLSRARFERLVEEVLASIPEPLRQRMDNVDIVIEAWPSAQQLETAGLEPGDWLFGLYEGTPLVQRGITAEPLLPDKITIFQGPLQEACDSEDEVRREVRTTVIHEIAHHFGIDEERLAELGYE